MKTFTLLAACLLFAGLAISADVSSTSLPSTAISKVTGEYMEARTADVYPGACFANSEVEFAGNLAVMGWKIEKGSFDGVNLDGLAVMAVVKAEGTLGDYMRTSNPAKAVLIIDQRASDEQRAALAGFAHRMGGELLSNVVRVESRLIQFTTNDIHSRRASMVAGELARIETRNNAGAAAVNIVGRELNESRFDAHDVRKQLAAHAMREAGERGALFVAGALIDDQDRFGGIRRAHVTAQRAFRFHHGHHREPLG